MVPADVRGRGLDPSTGEVMDMREWDRRFHADLSFRAAALANHERVVAFEEKMIAAERFATRKPAPNRAARRRERRRR